MISLLIDFFKKCIRFYKDTNSNYLHQVSYRIVDYFQNKEKEFVVQIQVLNKHFVFYSIPCDILKDDELVNKFSPLDIRTLTYLASNTINTPKYEIIAQRLSENNEILFAMKKQGNSNLILRRACEIMREQDIISGLSAKDAAQIGYALASDKH